MSNASELGAEWGEDRIESWFDIVVEDIEMFACFELDDNDGEFDDFSTGFHLFILDTGSFEV